MSEAPFEEFLRSHLLGYLEKEISPGQRYQFRSSDPGNTNELISNLREAADSSIELSGVSLPYISISEMRLICVAHKDDPQIAEGFNENYISMLRDKVAGQDGDFENSALLIIHNSLLDTLNNSALVLSDSGSAWSLELIRNSLSEASENHKSHKVFDTLLDWQAEIIAEDEGTVFGFKQIYQSISNGSDLTLKPLGLLEDSGLAEMNAQSQIKRRLEDNREIYERFEWVAHHFPDEIPERLRVSEKFAKKHFGEGAEILWKEVDYQEIKDELSQQDERKLEFVKISSELIENIVGPKSESTSSAGKRRKHVILVAEQGAALFDVSIEFIGDELSKSDVHVEHNESVKSQCSVVVKKTKNRRRVMLECPFDGKPTFFRLRLDRKLTSERFDFRFLVLTKDEFHVLGFENKFLIKTDEKNEDKNHLLLQTEDRELLINPDLAERTSLSENEQVVSTEDSGTVDYGVLYEESDIVSFTVENEGHELKFQVEGEISQDSLTLPLLMDTGRFNRLFDDNYNGSYLPEKQRVVIDNQETNVVAIRAKVLEIEDAFIKNRLLCFSDQESRSLPALSMKEFAPELFEAWQEFVDYLARKKTLPSLASWGHEMIDLVGRYVDAYQNFLANIELGRSLNDNSRKVLDLGMAEFDGRKFFTPFHPLVLGYFQYLAGEITKDEESRSFKDVPPVTRRRLNVRGLVPFLYSERSKFSYTQTLDENAYWLEIVPQAESSYDYVQKLTFEKIREFVRTFDVLFKDGTDAPLLINSVNNVENEDIFKGILRYFREEGNESEKIHVNLYDDEFVETEFDRFAELGTYAAIKTRYGLEKGKAKEFADRIIDLLRSRLTFSKFKTKEVEEQAYAHLTFFRNNQAVQPVSIDIREHISGVACDGLLNGEASSSENQSYFTGFGLRNVETEELPHLEIARMVGTLQKPLIARSESYNKSSAIRLAVSDQFRELLDRSYESSLWVTIIDPKVTLKFFQKTRDVVLIHFSDQYTNSAGYDAITVTKQTELYRDILKHGTKEAVGEFNSFNGEWLLKMVTAPDKIRDERQGIIGAWKLVSCLLSKSDITWVPLSVAEMVRVSGNIGLKLSDSDFSRYHKKNEFKGKMSDDVLFAGFKDDKLYLLPVEVKTGSADFKKADGQAKALREYLVDGLFGPRTLEAKIYRSLFVRQILMQIEKYELYEVFPTDYFNGILEYRESWLKGDYHVANLADYPDGFVVAHLKGETHFETKCSVEDGIGRIELPISYLDSLLKIPRTALQEKLQEENYLNIRGDFFLGVQQGILESQENQEVGYENKPDSPESKSRMEGSSVSLNTLAAEDAGFPPGEIQFDPETSLRIKFGTNVKDNEPAFWEPTNTRKVMNPNAAIIGTMGTGKTQFTKSLVTQLAQSQDHNVDGMPIGILILDYKADYVKDDFVKATNAKVIELHKLPFNPFALFGRKPMLPVHTASQFRTTITKAFGLGNRQQNKINSLVLEAYENEGIIRNDSSTWGAAAPTLQDVWNVYQAQEKIEEDSLHAALDQLITFEIFEPDKTKTQSLYDMIEGVTVINLSGYDEIIQNLVVALVLDIFFAQMHQKGSSKVNGDHRQLTKFILVDEADNFMKQEFPGLRKLLKEGREFGVGTILSTQELTHFKTTNNDYSSYILSWVIHNVSSIKPQDVRSLFNVSTKDECDRVMNSIRELEKHFSLFVDGDKSISKIKDLAFWELLKNG